MNTIEEDIRWVCSVCKFPGFKVIEPSVQALVALYSDIGKPLPSETTLIIFATIGLLITQVRMLDETKLDTIPTEVFKQVAHSMVIGNTSDAESYKVFNTEYKNL